MADKSSESVLDAKYEESNCSTSSGRFNKNCAEFKPLFHHYYANVKQSQVLVSDENEVENFESIGSALDELLAQSASERCCNKYKDTPSVSPSPLASTTHTTPQLSSVMLPPPPGYEPIVDPSDCSPYSGVYCDPSMYSSPTESFRGYPPPFHLGHKLFVGALPYSVTEADLFPLFSQYGEILELHIQRDWLGRSKGCAWLRYSSVEECDLAIDALHNNFYLGSPHISFS